MDLLPAWVDVDTDDALELLGSSFENRKVRSYAVAQLRSANDDVSRDAKEQSNVMSIAVLTFFFSVADNRICCFSFFSWCRDLSLSILTTVLRNPTWLLF